MALGAEVTLHIVDGLALSRDVRAASGYLSGDPSRLHFGAPDGDGPAWLKIEWPDGATSVVNQLSMNTLITAVR